MVQRSTLVSTDNGIRPRRSSDDLGQTTGLEDTTFNSGQPRPWHASMTTMSVKLWRQLLGLNPFKGSYFGLYTTLHNPLDQALAYCGVVFAIAAGVPLPIIGVIFGRIIDAFPPDEDELRNFVTQLLGVAVAYFVVTTLYTTIFSRTGERIAISLRERLLETLMYADQAYLDVEDLDYNGLLRDSIDTIQVGCSEKIGIFIQSMTYFVAAFTVGFILNAKLTGILFAAVIPTMTILVAIGSTSVSKCTRQVTVHTEKANAIALSALRAVKIVQAFDMMDSICDLHTKQLDESSRLGIRKAMASALQLGGAYFVAYAANGLAFYVGSHMAEAGEAGGNAGTIYAVVFLILDAAFVVGQFAPFLEIFARSASAYGKILLVLEIPTTTRNSQCQGNRAVSIEGQELRIKNVSFSYPARPDAMVLKGLDMLLKPGTFNAVVGTSGGGKSTLLSLLLEVYKYSGSISIGPHELSGIDKFWLRSQIAVLDQDCVLFSGTILENIRYGLAGRNVTESESTRLCEHAVADAGIDFLSDLSDGWHTRIDNTIQLSGGQRQRVCLARALVSKPSILVLDEPTSALDARSELKVLDAVRNAVADGMMIIMIAHRLSTVMSADNIVVLQDGRTVEQGSPAELSQEGTVFSGLLAAQNMNADTQPHTVDISDNSTAEVVEKSNTIEIEDGLQTAQSAAECGRPSVRTVLSCFFRLSRPERHIILAGMLAAIVSGAMIVGEAIVFGHLVQLLNTGQGDADFQRKANFFCLMFFVLACIALGSYVSSGTAFGVASSRLVARVQTSLLQTVLRLDLAWFAEQDHSAPTLASTFAKDSSDLSCLSGVALGTICTVFVSVCGGIILAHIVAWKIAIVLLSAVPVMIAAGFVRLRLLAKSEHRHRTAYSGATGLAVEMCHGRRSVSILGLEELNLGRYHDGLWKPYKEGLLPTVACNLLLALSFAITYFVYALAYWWGSKQVRNGTYTQQQFFTVLPALLFSAQSAGQLFSLSPELARARTAAVSIFQLLSSKPNILTSPLGSTASDPEKSLTSSIDSLPKSRPPALEFRNVSFSYTESSGNTVLANVSFKAERGQTIALVGPSGAGKSSIISLCGRFYDPVSGEILLDGTDLRDQDVQKLRKQMSLLSQDAELFPGSIGYNIRLGATNRSITQQDVESAAAQCGIHDFISSLPDGYATECGSVGNSQLSGGQSQRIALARALLRDPRVLLLDEPTSSLDAISEKQVQEALASAEEGRTTIIVAHRLASIQHVA